MQESIEMLRKPVEQLNNLLKNPEVGLIIWHKFVSLRLKEINIIYKQMTKEQP